MRQVDRLTVEMLELRQTISPHQPACKALHANHYGIAPLTSTVIRAQMGDCCRLAGVDTPRRRSHRTGAPASDARGGLHGKIDR